MSINTTLSYVGSAAGNVAAYAKPEVAVGCTAALAALYLAPRLLGDSQATKCVDALFSQIKWGLGFEEGPYAPGSDDFIKGCTYMGLAIAAKAAVEKAVSSFFSAK